MSKAQQWRDRAAEAARQEAVELTLPSGMVILARRPSLAEVAMWGGLPLSLAAAQQGKSAPELSAQEVLGVFEFARTVLLNTVIEPRISLTPSGPDEIHPREISGPDLDFVLAWAQRGEEARNLESFRGQRTDAGGGSDGESVLGQTF